MNGIELSFRLRGFAATVLVLAPVFPAIAATADATNDLALKIPNESAPPGGWFQMKVKVTEPKPIIISSAAMSSPFAVQGIVLPGSPDAGGAAVLGPSGLVLRTISPSGTMGMSLAAPIIAVTFAVPAGMPVGAKAQLVLDPAASSFLAPLGVYVPDVKQGMFTAGGTLSIGDIIPGGGFLPAGSAITVTGMGFQPGALVEVDGIDIVSATLIDSTRIDAVIAAAAQLDGRRVSVRNPDGTRAAYFSYLRARALGESARPLLLATETVFPVLPFSGAIFPVPAVAAGTFFAVAAQNPGPATSQVTIALQSPAGVVASTTFSMPPRTEISREISEFLTGVSPHAGQAVAVTASAPVQLLGLVADTDAGSVTPVLPALSF